MADNSIRFKIFQNGFDLSDPAVFGWEMAVVQQGERDRTIIFGYLCCQFCLPVRSIGTAPAVQDEGFRHHNNTLRSLDIFSYLFIDLNNFLNVTCFDIFKFLIRIQYHIRHAKERALLFLKGFNGHFIRRIDHYAEMWML